MGTFDPYGPDAETEDRQWRMQERFSKLFKFMCEFHSNHSSWSSGHDLFHDLFVAGYAVRIADDLAKDAETTELHEAAWVAAMLHSTDRFMSHADLELFLPAVMNRNLGKGRRFSIAMKEQVVRAVLDHNKPNSPEDGPVTLILKDADRLANINPLVVIRSAQFQHNLPTHDPRHLGLQRAPGSTYRDPRTILCDLYGCIEWETWLRLPMAQAIGAKYFEFLKTFYALIEAAHIETGVGGAVLNAEPVLHYLAAMDAAHKRAT